MLEEAAESVYYSALKRIEKTEMAWGKSHPRLVNDLRNLSDLFFVFGEYEKAKPLYWRILDIQQNTKKGILNPETVDTLLSLGEIYEAENDFAKAEQLLRAALGILTSNDIFGSEIEVRILLKLYGILKLSNQQEKILEIENKLYVFLNNYAANVEAKVVPSSTPVNPPVSTTAPTVEQEKPRLLSIYNAA